MATAAVRVAAKPKGRALAPGARGVIRDEEWIVRSVKPASWGGSAVHVIGTSELVRGKQAIFLTELDDVKELRPEETTLVHDDSPHYRRSRLYLEALLRRSPPTDDALYVGHRGAIRRADYQLQPAAKALRQPRPRILMADGVGLGKTIEVGILLSELIRRGRGDRILVVALKSILAQFQEELWARFTIPLVRLDSIGIQHVQSKIPSNMNPFYYFDRVIISVDTLKKDEKYRRYLEQCQWDAVVVDECQNVAVRTTGGPSQQSQRARLAQLLARTTDALILTSATPHDGRPESFASLMNLLEPTAVANESNYTADEVRDLYLRRFKKDVAHEVQGEFSERELTLEKISAAPAEDAVFDYLHDLKFKTIARDRGGKGVLFTTLLLKAFLSSPAACASTIRQRLGHKDLQGDDEPARHDRQVLDELARLVDAVRPADFRKLQHFLFLLRGLGLDHPDCQERMVVFSERIDTLNFLHDQVRKELKLGARQVEIFHGSLDDHTQMELVKGFGTESSPLRLLLASDAAAEGINLHYFCHRMVHFDLPWSLITLEQRNGRIDRFGQDKTPEIAYLLTIPGDENLAGDLRVLERLIEKEDHAQKNLGDVAWLMNLHDREKEEDRIAASIERGEAPESIIPEEEAHGGFLDIFLNAAQESEPLPEVKEPPRLYPDDLAYAREAFRAVLGDDGAHVEWHDHIDGFTLHPPDDLLRRFDYLPRELRRDGDAMQLTTDRKRVMDALDESRQDENHWPDWQLFWQLHPVAGWLDDRLLAEFGRHDAPVLRVARGVAPEERVLVFQSVVSNHRSQPVLVEWFGVRFAGGDFTGIVPFEELIPAAGLSATMPNPGGGLSAALTTELESLRAPAVERAREYMLGLRKHRSGLLGQPLREGLRKVKRWLDDRLSELEKQEKGTDNPTSGAGRAHLKRIERQRHEARELYESRRRWIEEGMRTVEEPYLRLAAVLIHTGVH
jgi:hypothetical protein